MEEHIHDTDREKHPKEKYMSSKKSYCEKDDDTHKCYKSEYSSFDKLLYIPAFWDILSIDIFYFFSGFSSEFLYISIGWTGTSESLSEWMLSESLYTELHTFHMSIRRSSAHEEGLHRTSVLHEDATDDKQTDKE